MLDQWLVRSGVLDGWAQPLVVDVGIGAQPDTTLELFAALTRVQPEAQVLGTDIDPERVQAAQRHARPGLSFATAGFQLELQRPASVIRAMNILRQYRPEQVAEAHGQLGASLGEGGVLLEGTCGPAGQVLGCLVLRRRKGELHREALILAAQQARGFAPLMLRDRLPRDLRDKGNPGHPVGDFLARWTQVWQICRQARDTPRQSLARSARALAAQGEPLDLQAVDEGVVVWRPVDGVPGR